MKFFRRPWKKGRQTAFSLLRMLLTRNIIRIWSPIFLPVERQTEFTEDLFSFRLMLLI